MDDYPHMYESITKLVLLDIWIVLTGLVNLAANSLILYCLIKAKLFRPIYILIFHVTALDIIQQLFCPTVFKLFANIDDIFKDFTNHKVFTCIYFTALHFIAIVMFILMLRIHLKCLDKTYWYILGVCWILAIIAFTATFINFEPYRYISNFALPYFLLLAVLLIYVHIHQIRTTLKYGEYSGVDYQVSLLVVLTFVSTRLVGVLLFALGEITYGLVPLLSYYFILGALQLVSIANLLIIARFEEKAKNHLWFIFGSRRRRRVNEFTALEEDHALPE